MELISTLVGPDQLLIRRSNPFIENLSSYREKCSCIPSPFNTLFEFDIERHVSWDHYGLKPFFYSLMINCIVTDIIF